MTGDSRGKNTFDSTHRKPSTVFCKKGEVTVFLSLMLAVLLFFFQACLSSARFAFLRSQTQEALELAEYSILSEYHRELFEQYGLLYVELGYGSGLEDTEYLKQRLRGFLKENLPRGSVNALEAWNFSRASDNRGMAYYEQAVSYMKQKTGAALLEQLRSCEALGKQAQEQSEEYEEIEAREQKNLEELRQRREDEEQAYTPDPVSSISSLKEGSLLHLLLPDAGGVSGKRADLEKVPSRRNCLTGSGSRGIHKGNAANDLFFHGYLLENLTNAVEFLAEGEETGLWLDYQIEYLIGGEDTDIANLETVCRRILAIREGMNYAYLQTDTAKKAECEALAIALVGVTMVPGLVEAVKQALLLAWAFAESIADVRTLLGGKKCAFWKGDGTWRTSLEGALNLQNSASGFGDEEDAKGLSYEDYLGILLAAVGRETKTMRSLDVIEGVIKRISGCGGFYIDQCTDGFQVRAVIFNGKEWTAERTFCYEWQ
jgi:hypothetical protein